MTKARDIADGVDTADIADGAISTAKIADNSVNATKIDVSGNGTAGQFLSSDGDGTMTWADAGGGFDLGTALTGTTPTIDWSSATAFSHTLSGNTTYSFSNVPSGGEIELFIKNAGEQYDLLTPRPTTGYDASTSSVIITTQPLNNLIFKPDGTKMYVTVGSGNYQISQYSLSTAWDISTASFDNKVSPVLSTSFTTLGNQAFNDDGTILFISYGDTIYEHALSTSYDISTMATTATNSKSVTSLFQTGGYTGTQPGLYRNRMIWLDSGSSLILMGTNHGGRVSSNKMPTAIKVSLSSPYDITSTFTHQSTFDLSEHGFTVFDDAVQMDISDDGFQLICSHRTIGDPSYRRHRYRFLLRVPFDLSTATFVNSLSYYSANTNVESQNILRIVYNKFLVTADQQSASALNSDMYNFTISTNYEIVFPSGTSPIPIGIGTGSDPSTTTYLRMVSLDGTNVLITDHREI